jgi:hypothetical protein
VGDRAPEGEGAKGALGANHQENRIICVDMSPEEGIFPATREASQGLPAANPCLDTRWFGVEVGFFLMAKLFGEEMEKES